MDDLYLTKACAEAMGHIPMQAPSGVLTVIDGSREFTYQPLHDDAQAMALVKKFNSCIKIRHETVDYGLEIKPPYWEVQNYYPDRPPNYGGIGRNADFNRAIVECMAEMQAATAPPQ